MNEAAMSGEAIEPDMADGPRGDGAAAPERVALTWLSLSELRNYPALTLALSGRSVVLTGPNGAGKTNLLEAISLLSPGRGLRRASYEEIARSGTERGWAVAARVERAGNETRIGTGTRDAPPGARRRVRIDGVDRPAEAMLEHLRILWLTPVQDGLFTGPAGDRRRFLDRLVLAVDPAHGRRAAELERLLQSRNRLLEESGPAGVLDAIETQLAESAVAVSFARAETVGLLSHLVEALAKLPGDFPAASLALSGPFEEARQGLAAAAAEEAYRGRLRAARATDRAAGRTLDGPHRTDLEVRLAAKEMPAGLASTGEQKALLVTLTLAHAELVARTAGFTPILLLDEIAAHLDETRRAALFDRVEALAAQAFMTGTDASLFEALGPRAEAFNVVDGRVIPA
jgi:DNA replication and repair protein RecF